MSKFIILSPCRFSNAHHDKGEELELDIDKAEHAQLVAALNYAGRIALVTPELRKQISQEVALEKAEQARVAKVLKGREGAE